ncbi:T9SS type A sorting domain-containing protein [Cytophagaceae bacterium DM2B3-1]|uniref:T9SS type A sorting domain-containing protein n=1 Tax=Xanthocytophaga flava TaxID=3048013 RepID=A0ABT7CR98_9BACT|nr:T9SS type A sorting domain-containing protein [Xanthocytophaga flavus]MDJ1470436.1 T9SS type A sorting domain-containing protein [Xanthocytophaga flavus]MDJ1496274.1 T9SS type A sorting domain-containing protein [Xanthocytophaga flavus]
MKKKFTIQKILVFLLLSWMVIQQSKGQTSVFKSTSRKIVYAYEGFDYFGSVRVPGQFGQAPSSLNNPLTPGVSRATEASQASATGLNLHNINTNKSNTNSATALGWAGDWVASNGASTPYELSTTTLENIVNSPNSAPSPNTSNEKFSLINSGFYATVSKNGGGTIGRRLQTSTGGYFYEYEIFDENNQNNRLDNTYTDAYWYNAGINARDRFVRTLSESTIRTLGSSNAAIHKVSERTGPLPTSGTDPAGSGNKYTGKTYTSNTSIGANGSTIWLGFLMRLSNVANNEDAFVNLHLNNNPYQVDNNKVSIGYFGTTDPASFGLGATKRWGLRIGSTSYVSPLAIGDVADSSAVIPDKFTLLVVSITFDYSGNNTVKFFVINDNSKYYDDITGDGVIDAPTPIGIFSVAGDLSFHSLAYNGGNTIGRSDIDEIRFARSYDLAALSSQSVAMVRDLCESDMNGDGDPDGQAGINVNQGGDLGYSNVTDANSNGKYEVGEVPATETVGGDPTNLSDTSFSTYSKVYDPANSPGNDPDNAKDRVIFMNGNSTLFGTRFDALAPGFNYTTNTNSQPNDGNYYVGTQSRNPFGREGGWPVWINAYDNSGDKLGNMMVVNAAYSRNLFFQQEVSGICPGTQYEFYADILNLFNRQIKSVTNLSASKQDYSCGCYPSLEPGCGQFSAAGTDQALSDGLGGATRTGDWNLPSGVTATQECFGLNPEIEFLIDGVPVYIPPISINNDEKWHRVGFTFITKDPPSGKITVAVRNRAPGGSGNDLAMDNFIFRPCGPQLNLTDAVVCSDTSNHVIEYIPTGKTYRKPYYRWVIKPPLCQSNCNDSIPSKRVYCLANCGTDPNDDSDNPDDAVYVEDPDTTKWLVVGGKAFYASGVARLSLDTLDRNTSDFLTVFPGGFIPKGTQIMVYSASESDANTTSGNCRIAGAPATLVCDFLTLPASLLQFTAKVESEMVRVDWKVDNEKGVQEYIVERSTNAKDFIAVGNVAAKGGNNTVLSYYFYDQNPLDGTSYYRLRIIDTDGTYKYSKVVSVDVNISFAVYPIPASDEAIVVMLDENKKSRDVQIKLTNTLGQALLASDYTLPAGSQEIKVPVIHLVSGVYVMEIVTGTQVTKKRIIIAR